MVSLRYMELIVSQNQRLIIPVTVIDHYPPLSDKCTAKYINIERKISGQSNLDKRQNERYGNFTKYELDK